MHLKGLIPFSFLAARIKVSKTLLPSSGNKAQQQNFATRDLFLPKCIMQQTKDHKLVMQPCTPTLFNVHLHPNFANVSFLKTLASFQNLSSVSLGSFPTPDTANPSLHTTKLVDCELRVSSLTRT